MPDLEQVLEKCVAEIERGEATLDECLMRYPEHQLELGPHLLAINRLKRARAIQPAPAFRMEARAELMAHMRAHPRRKPHASRMSLVFPTFRFAFALAAIVLVVLLSGTALAQAALPGDMLYTWKLASEQVWRGFATDSLAADLALAARRAEELQRVSGDPFAERVALENYQASLIVLSKYSDANSQTIIRNVLIKQKQDLEQAGVVVPLLDEFLPEMPSIPTPVPTLPAIVPAPNTSTPYPTLTVAPTLQPTIALPTRPAPTATIQALPTALPIAPLQSTTIPVPPVAPTAASLPPLPSTPVPLPSLPLPVPTIPGLP